jgi:hypothetical protein
MDKLPDGLHFGEVIGPRVQNNHYQMTEHLWVPFATYCKPNLRYTSWGKYPKDFQTISDWFRYSLHSLYFQRHNPGQKVFAEGVVFYHPDGRMAKLRRNMFDWWDGPRHKRNNRRRPKV